MKKHSNIFEKKLSKVLLVSALCLTTLLSYSQTKRGLIIAIGDYPENTEWRDISSANDVPLIRSAMQKQGFQSENINVLLNEQATKDKIVGAINDLISRSKTGDIVILHFSSHGQQIEDDNGDELDGYDEAIVAYGAPAKYTPDYDFSQHLRDDELEILLQNLRLKVGPTGDVIVFVDACHSGTVSRGEISRGGMPAYQRPDYQPGNGKKDVGMYQTAKKMKVDASLLSPMVVVSASQASEVNYEYKGAGSLSTAISRSVDKLNPSMSYRAFFAQILKEMSSLAPSQKPAIEGDIDRSLLGGHVIEQEPYYTAYKIRDNSAYMYGGKLNGIHAGTELAVYPIGTISTVGKKPIAVGEALFSEGTWSKLKLDKDLEGNPEDYWFFVTKQSFGDISLHVSIDIKNGQIAKSLEEALLKSPLFKIAKEDLDIRLEDGGRGTIDIIRVSDNSVFAENLSSENEYSEVIKTLQDYSRGAYMKNLELTDPRFNVTFEFIPVVVDEEGLIVDTLTMEEISENGTMVFTEKIAALIKATNWGNEDAYFCIIDIQPDGKINGILPGEDPALKQNPEDFLIKAGQSKVFDETIVYFGAPYGMEVFKLFASKEAIDFTPILTKKPRTRSYISPLETLFEDGLNESTRGGTTKKIQSTGMEASTSYISFEIRE